MSEVGRRGQFIEALQHRWAGPPRHRGRSNGDVVAILCDNRNEKLRFEADAFQVIDELSLYTFKTLLAVVHQVHFVDENNDLANAQKVEQIPVSPGLLL